jgi:hypothetical protein
MMYADRCCTWTELTENGQQFYIVTGVCTITKKKYSVNVRAEGLHKYRKGALIQEAFPGVPAEDREFLMSGISPEGWEILFDGSEGR